MARLGAPPAPDADAEVEGVAELDAGLRSHIADFNLSAVVLEGLRFESAKDLLELLGRQLGVVALEELFEGLIGGPLCDGSRCLGEGCGAQKERAALE